MTTENNRKEGIVAANPKGFGFINTAEGEEFFVPPALMRRMVPGDRVSFVVEAGNRPGQFQAARPRLISRKASVWLGTVTCENGYWLLVPDESCFVKLSIEGVSYIQPGVVVSVRLPAAEGDASGGQSMVSVKLERILGDRSRKGFDADYALAKQDFAPVASPAALQQAANLPTEVDAIELMRSDRKDLRKLPFVTIDGESTRDFDDAVYAIKNAEGFEVQVAIADVSHYVRPQSALDKEAQSRATSVYLPGKCVPMLPEALSTGLCSLNPGVDRLAVVVSIQLSPEGDVLRSSYTRAVIQSKARLTYNQVTEVLEHKQTNVYSAQIHNNLDTLFEVYQLMDAQRKARGVLEFEDPEPKLVTLPNGELSLTWEHRTVAHKLVEEMMLLANRCVAHMLFEAQKGGLFRHQALPQKEDWDELKTWSAGRGYVLADQPSLEAMADLSNQARNEEERAIIDMRIRQVMQPALYVADAEQSSHFSLGFVSYTHFTSPIRRYADLVAHRLLLGVDTGDVEAHAEHCSERARAARFAERQVWDRLKKSLMVRDVPKTAPLDAHVVSVNRRGVRVVVDSWQCAVWVPAESLIEEEFSLADSPILWHKQNKPVEPGMRMPVCWDSIEEARGRLEIQARLA